MRLLVSVATAAEAVAALDGGADVIDAKDPAAGPLGAVSVEVLREIHTAVAGRQLLTAALGDALDERDIEDAARACAAAGAQFVKIGFSGISETDTVAALIAGAVRGVRSRRSQTGVIAVAYADANRMHGLHPTTIVHIAASAGATGVLLDTADKTGPGLRKLVAPSALAEWVVTAHRAGLLVALAGQLTAADFDVVREAGADIAGVRGAACEGGRLGTVTAERVRALVNEVRLKPDTTEEPLQPTPTKSPIHPFTNSPAPAGNLICRNDQPRNAVG